MKEFLFTKRYFNLNVKNYMLISKCSWYLKELSDLHLIVLSLHNTILSVEYVV